MKSIDLHKIMQAIVDKAVQIGEPDFFGNYRWGNSNATVRVNYVKYEVQNFIWNDWRGQGIQWDRKKD